MKIVFSDQKKGIFKVVPENVDDLWHLSHVVDVNDTVESITYRREEKRDDINRSVAREKKKVKLTIKVQKVELKEGLRISGVITQGAESLGSFHTFIIGPKDTLTITKERWPAHLIERLKDAQKSTNRPLVLLLVLDDESADFALIRQTNVEFLVTIEGKKRGKLFESKDTTNQYFSKIHMALTEYCQRETLKKIVIAGPGFVKDDLFSYIQKKDQELSKNIIVTSTSVVGRTGIYEIIKSKIIDKVLDELQSVQEITKIETLLYEISKSKKAAYGFDEVKRAQELGAVDTLLIVDTKIKEKEVETLMEHSRDTKSSVMIINHEHEGGEKLKSLGGIAALLRYPI